MLPSLPIQCPSSVTFEDTSACWSVSIYAQQAGLRMQDIILDCLQVLALETDRAKAESNYTKARAGLADLQQVCDKMQLQNQLLQKLLDIQLKHNRAHVTGLHRFLESDSFQNRPPLSDVDLSSPSTSSIDVSSESDTSRGPGRRGDVFSSADLEQSIMPPSLLMSGGIRMHRHKSHRKGNKHR